jgi:hypothetical protein
MSWLKWIAMKQRRLSEKAPLYFDRLSTSLPEGGICSAPAAIYGGEG